MTPFYPDGRLYLKKLEHNVDRYSQGPGTTLLVLGTTGEAVMVTDAESREVLKVAAGAAAADKVLMAGVGRESVAATLEMCEAAAEFGYDCVLARTPHYFKPIMQRADALEMLTYFRTLGDKSPLPVLIYNFPTMMGYDMPVDVVVELAGHPNVIGMKDSGAGPARIAEIVARTAEFKRTVTVTQTFGAVTGRMLAARPGEGAATFVSAEALSGGAGVAVAPPRAAIKTRTKEVGFQVLTGVTGTLLEGLKAGANGAILGLACCSPQACFEVLSAYKDGDMALAEEKAERLIAANQRVSVELGVPGLKYACDLNGYYGGRPRLPLLPLTGDEQREVQELMAGIPN